MKSEIAVKAWTDRKVLLCDVCDVDLGPIEDHVTGEFGGRAVTPEEEITLSKDNPACFIVCQKCLDKMPDASDLFLADGTEVELIPGLPVSVN